MDKELKLYSYIDGVNDIPFPSSEDQAIITSFQYDSKRMGGAPTISATLMHKKCLDKLWTYKVYATFNGEKYFIKQIPSSSYSNTDILYKHDIDLVSERVVLDNVYVYDAVSSEAVYDRPVSNSTKFTFFGDIHEFAKRLNYSLEYRKIGYSVVVDDGISSEGKMVSFENTVFSNAIQESYNTYEIPYYFVGKVIHFGFTDNAITEIFKYGAQNSLLSIQKNNANNKVVTRITGTGSSDNIPYYYPNDSEKGEVTILYNGVESENVSLQDEYKFSNFKLEDKLQYKFVESREVELISSYKVNNYSFTQGDDYDGAKIDFDVETRITIPSYDNIELKLTIYGNIDTYVYFNEPKTGKTQSYYSFVGENETISVKLSSGTYILLVTSKAYLLNSTEINTIEEAEEYIRSIFNISAKYTYQESNFWSKNDLVISLSDYGIALAEGVTPTDGDYITLRQDKYIQPSDKLLPPIYRGTDGKERFYEAINNAYTNPQTGLYYEFNNEFVENNPKEHIVSFEDIKPTIKGMTNALGQRIDMFTEFAYDLNDNDDTYSDASDKAGEYIHPYFFAKLRKFDGEYGFNLFDYAIDEEEMTISMTSGNCGACEWIIGVDEDTQKNIVQVDENGNLLRDEDGNVLLGAPQDRQNDTKNYEVWIALKKDINTFGVIMPNASSNYKPASGDTFVILHIDLPKSYILSAENKLKEELIKYMAYNNEEKFNFSISFSRIYFAENPDILASLNENARLNIEYDGGIYELYVSSYSYKMSNDSPLPEIRIELSDSIAVSQNAMQNAIDKVEEDIMHNVGSIDWLKLGLSRFIRKDKDDSTKNSLSIGRNLSVGNNLNVGSNLSVGNSVSIKNDLIAGGNTTLKKDLYVNGLMSLFKGATSNNFLSGFLGSGFELRKDEKTGRWRLEVDELLVRMVAAFFELVIHKIRHVGGSIILSPASMECVKVEDKDGVYRCYFKATDGEKTVKNEFYVGDQARCQSFNLKQENGITKTKFYWRLVTAVGEDWIELSKSDCADRSGEPEVGDDIVQLGNRNDASRQNAIILDTTGDDSPSIKQYAHINSYSLTGKEVTVFSPLENRIKGKFINTAGEDINSSIIAFKKQIEEFKERNDRELTLWFFDHAPTLENAPASEWSDEEKSLHLEDLFYNRADGIAYRFTVNESGVYSWEVITDQDTIRALEKANQAQDTADGKRRTFISTPTDADEYDVGDIWVNATYGEYSNDSLVCKQSKKTGEPFSITHWQASSNATTAYIQNLGDKILLVVQENKTAGDLAIDAAKQAAEEAAKAAATAQGTADEANGLATTNATAIVQGKEALSLLAGKFTFDKDGNVVNIDKSGLLLTADAATLYTKKEETNKLGDRVTTAEGQIKTTSDNLDAFVKKVNFDENGKVTNIDKSGLVMTSDFAKMFSESVDNSDIVKRAEISTMVTKDENGNLESGVKISADQITMSGTVQFASPTDVSTAKNEAISAASQDATQKANTAQSNAEKTATNKVDTLKNTLKGLAYKDKVGLEQIDGTVIEGGKILTSLIKADELQVKSVHAENSDGTTTCHIDGETGQLEAYNAILSGTLMTKMFLIENESSFNEVFSSEDTGTYWIKIKLNKRITNINVCWWRYYMSVSDTTSYHAYSLYMEDLDANMEGAEVIIHLGPTQVYMHNGLPVKYKTVKYVDGSFQYEDAIEYLQYGGSIRLKYVNSLVHRESGGKGFYWIKIA